jgi:hypothetical protein
MSGWQTQLVFEGDTLVAETLNEVELDAIQFSTDPTSAPDGDALTVVVVSGYALYGQVRGYYALGVAQLRVDRKTGMGYMSERSEAHQEPMSSLSTKQKQAVCEWLRVYNPSAWETSLDAFKKSLQ